MNAKKKMTKKKAGVRQPAKQKAVALSNAPSIFQRIEMIRPGLAGLAVILAWMGQSQFSAHRLAMGLVFWILAAVVGGVAFWPQPDRIVSDIDNQWRIEALILGLVTLTALTVRVWQLADLPHGFHFDEAVNALIGLQIIKDPGYLPIFGPSDAPLPTLFHYFNVVALSFIGISTYATKFVPVFAGTATVVMFYFLARRMVSRPVALAGAMLFALMRWHINFSRINFVGILTPLFGVAAAYFLIRGMETKNRWHMAFSGLSVALGLYTYYASNLVPFVLGPYMVLQLVWDRKFLKEQWQNLVVFLIVSLAVFAPLGYFAMTEKGRFFARNGQVLIFNHVPPDQAMAALWRNIKTTLLMFNYFGDCNGRHNLPEAPMLSPIAGILFGLGLIGALVRIGRRHNFLAVWWFLVALVPGFLTIEAPQGYRCIGAIVPVMLITTMGLERVWQVMENLSRGLVLRQWLWIGLAVLVSLIGARNLYDYFVPQAEHVACWSEFSAPQYAIGKRMHELGPDYHTYISAGSYDYPTIRFVAYPYYDAEPFDMIRSIPASYEEGKNVAYMLLPIHDNALELLRHYYPKGEENIYNSPYDFSLFTSYEVSRDDVAAARGFKADYQSGSGGIKTFYEGGHGLKLSPAEHGLHQPVRITWSGSLRIPFWRPYQIRVQGAENADIRLDGNRMPSDGMVLAQGMHTVSIQTGWVAPEQQLELQWRNAQTGPWNNIPGNMLSPISEIHGLHGSYYRATDWQGQPTFERIDPLLSLLGHDFTMSAPFSVRWEGVITVPEKGRYTFGTLSNERSWVYIDGQSVVANENVDQYEQGEIYLSQGRHAIRIDYQKKEGAYPRLVFYWIPPGKAKEKVPFKVLSTGTLHETRHSQ